MSSPQQAPISPCGCDVSLINFVMLFSLCDGAGLEGRGKEGAGGGWTSCLICVERGGGCGCRADQGDGKLICVSET